MNYPNPYFENVPDIGNLSIEYVIVKDVYPLLFVAIDDTVKRYLCVCCDIRGSQRWIINYLTDENMLDLFLNRLTLGDAFTKGNWAKVLATFDYEVRKDEYVVVDGDDIPKEDLPSEGEYLDEDLEDHLPYVLKLCGVSDENIEYEEPPVIIKDATLKTALSVNIPIKAHAPTNYFFSESRFLSSSKPEDDDLSAA